MNPKPLREQNCSRSDKPVVSVICAAYNHVRYIEPALESILSQRTGFPVEIIVHDDASTDGTNERVEDYAQRYPHLVTALIQRENQFSEFVKLRLRLLSHARGEYIALCDGDDLWLDASKLRKQVEFLENNRNFVISYHAASAIDAEGRTILPSLRADRLNRNFSASELRAGVAQWLPLSTVMHRNLLSDCPPEFDLSPNSDAFIPVLMGQYGGAVFQGDIHPSAIRMHATGVFSGKDRLSQSRMKVRSYLQILAYLLRNEEDEQAIALLRGKANAVFGSYCEDFTTARKRKI